MQALGWKYSGALDQLRLFAASMVILAHAKPPLDPNATGFFNAVYQAWADNGKAGVSLFLVLTGFLFTMNTQGGERPVAYGPFLIRRICRIVPMYVLIMVLVSAQSRGEWSVIDLLTFATFQVNAGHETGAYGQDILPIGPIWTIAVEVQFYLLFPLLIAAIKPSDFRRMSALIAVFVIFRLFLGSIDPVGMYYKSYHTLLGRMDQFLIGMIAACLYMRWGGGLGRLAGWAGVGVALILLTAWFLVFDIAQFPLNQLSFTIEALIMALLLISFHLSGGIGSFVGAAITTLGKASYSIYLLHLLIGTILMVTFDSLPIFQNHWLKVMVLMVLPTFALSLLTYYAIEKPFNALARKAR